MAMQNLSDCFKTNFKFLKFFALWQVREKRTLYKYYSFIFLVINLFIYNILLTINLLYTPWRVDLLIREVIFYFTEVAVTTKALMIIIMRDEIVEALNILDCDAFKGETEETKNIITQYVTKYKTFWKMNALLSNFCYFCLIIPPLLFNNNLNLPVCKYYFLNNDTISKYYIILFIYQSLGMYSHMTYNVNIDTFISGCIIMAMTQVDTLNHELCNLKMDIKSMNYTKMEIEIREQFYKYLEHHRIFLRYCSKVQDIISVTMFVQFSMASIIICVVLCGLTLASSKELFMFMISYFVVMVLQIFVPAWLCTQLRYQSQELVFAAYSSSWISRPEKYKNTLKLFMQRSNLEIKFIGCKMIPLSLDTFVSIMKTAYSFFTLIRNVQSEDAP